MCNKSTIILSFILFRYGPGDRSILNVIRIYFVDRDARTLRRLKRLSSTGWSSGGVGGEGHVRCSTIPLHNQIACPFSLQLPCYL